MGVMTHGTTATNQLQAADITSLQNLVRSQQNDVVKLFNDIGMWYVNPSKDQDFKNTLTNNTETTHKYFITALCRLLDEIPEDAFRGYTGQKILEKRTIEHIERISETPGTKGSQLPNLDTFISQNNGKAPKKKKGGNEKTSSSNEQNTQNITQNQKTNSSTNLPKHPKIDSGFVVTFKENTCTDNTNANDTINKIKVGIEMQTQNKSCENIFFRGFQYGVAIFQETNTLSNNNSQQNKNTSQKDVALFSQFPKVF